LEGTAVKFIATATIGFDHIDTEFCASRDIRWTNAPGCNSSSVMQYMASVFARLYLDKGYCLEDMTLGIIGAGNVGKKVAKMAKLFGMRVLVNDPPRERNEGKAGFVSLDYLKAAADILTFHVPLNMEGEDKTYHMLNAEFINQLNPGAIIVNSSRGEVVDNQALKNALSSGKLKEAVLDVWENEPEIDRELLKMVWIGTPHVAGYSLDGKANGTKMSVQAMNDFFKLGMDDGSPLVLPKPSEPDIKINGDSGEVLRDLCNSILKTYDVKNDHDRLLNEPSSFEKLRGDYPFRREFGAYNIYIPNCMMRDNELFRKIGYNVYGIK
jgi:erythronate-4-phosphate dehydrogenase